MRPKQIFQTKLYILILLFTTLLGSCISEGEETYVLEEPTIKASKMIIGGWKNSSVKILDEEGNEVKDEGFEDITSNIPEIEFGENGDYTITYPKGDTESGHWNISDDESTLYLGDMVWEIYSFGENKLVIILNYVYNGKTYYIMFILERTSSPETPSDNGEIPGLGETSDNNPYKPWGRNLISKITLTRRFTDDNTLNKSVYLFEYDNKSRIMEYTEQIYNTVNNTVARTEKFNFIYDDNKVYLYHNGELMNTGVIGNNGYLVEVHEGDLKDVNSTFRYDNDGYVTYLKTDNQEWYPEYKNPWGSVINMINTGIDYLKYDSDAINNSSIDFNGLFTTCYQWEWAMHYDYSGVVFGLFDFYGKRSYQVASEIKRGTHWTDEMTDWRTTDSETDNYILTSYQITRTGLNNPFVATYDIEY